jgi:hypothetical protein
VCLEGDGGAVPDAHQGQGRGERGVALRAYGASARPPPRLGARHASGAQASGRSRPVTIRRAAPPGPPAGGPRRTRSPRSGEGVHAGRIRAARATDRAGGRGGASLPRGQARCPDGRRRTRRGEGAAPPLQARHRAAGGRPTYRRAAHARGSSSALPPRRPRPRRSTLPPFGPPAAPGAARPPRSARCRA